MSPHVLHMTATPIPRTLSLTAYGDLDTTALHNLPAGRKPVTTRVVGEDDARWLTSSSGSGCARGGRRSSSARWSRSPKKMPGKAAGEEAERLAAGSCATSGSGSSTARCPPTEKAAAMEAFAAGETDVLVATTVIEVGIDVPNATVMLIEGAERFGVSQLHQLRGRVGRGEHPSQCLLFADRGGGDGAAPAPGGGARATASSWPRSTCCLRGEGEILGTRQNGLPRFPVANLPDDKRCWSKPATRSWRCSASTVPPGAGARAAARGRPPALRRRCRRPDPLMRVIAGKLKGQKLVAPQGWKVRPTSERVREAVFSTLGERVGAPSSSTSTAAPGRWRSRRSRAAPRAPCWSTATRARRSATSSGSGSATARGWSGPTPGAGWRAPRRLPSRSALTSSSSTPR